MFSYIIIYCLEDKVEINKIKLLSMLVTLIIIGTMFFGSFGNNIWSIVFITHILSLCSVILFYKKNIMEVLTAYTISYLILGIYSIVFGNLIFESINEIFSIEYINYQKIFIIYIPQWIMIFLCFRYIDKIKKIYKLILAEGFSKSIIIMSFVMDFILTFYLLELGEESQLLKNVIDIVLFIFFILITIYFGKVHQKSEQIFQLNEALTIKNDELRKIKHDYGAQISYLYGLCLMNRVDDLKKALKRIIDSNQSTPTAVEINESNNSLIALALQPAVDMGIHVMIKGAGDINLSEMPEMELYRVISNIVNNAIKAMNGEGTIIVKIFEHIESLIIKIENNGPKIDEEHMGKIFEAGFTTKNNTDKNHGFGLSIVKTLIENYDGKISVKSTDESTEFKIVLPIK